MKLPSLGENKTTQHDPAMTPWVPRNTKRTTPPEGLFAHRLLRALQVVASLRRQAGHQGLPRTDLDRCGPQGLPGVLGKCEVRIPHIGYVGDIYIYI